MGVIKIIKDTILRSGNAVIDKTGSFYINPYDDTGNWVGLTKSDLSFLVAYHKTELQDKYDKLYRYYRGSHDGIATKQRKAKFKPDNRIVMNYTKNIVRSFTGYTSSIPANVDIVDNYDDAQQNLISAVDAQVKDFYTLNKLNKFLSHETKLASIYGRGLALIYQDNLSQTRVAALDPTEGFVIYSQSVDHEPLYGIRYIYSGDKTLADIYCYSEHFETNLNGDVDKFINYSIAKNVDVNDITGVVEFEQQALNYGRLPLVEFYMDEEKMGLYEDVLSIIDALDDAVSEKKNDVDYFGDSILKVVNAIIAGKDNAYKNLQDKRIIEMNSTTDKPADASFLTKESADGTQENLINRLLVALYDITGVVNLNDKDFTNAASGTALKNRLQSMRELADTTATSFSESLTAIISSFLTMNRQSEFIPNIRIKFNKNEPIDLLDISTAMINLSNSVAGGFISHETALTSIPLIEDAQQEITKIENERASKISNLMTEFEDDATGSARVVDDEE